MNPLYVLRLVLAFIVGWFTVDLGPQPEAAIVVFAAYVTGVLVSVSRPSRGE